MTLTTREKGSKVESTVASFLESFGYEITVRNKYLGKLGELDLIVKKEIYLFVEVRKVKLNQLKAGRVISPIKLVRLKKLAEYWLRNSDVEYRIDLFLAVEKNEVRSRADLDQLFPATIWRQVIFDYLGNYLIWIKGVT
jgi:Holliday junction resolvase-like predicted endonuclease